MNAKRSQVDRPLGADWVWIGDGADDQNAYVCFRREFDAAAGTVLRIAAESRYKAWLNGRFIGEGPPPSTPQLPYFDTHDLTEMALAGANCLAVVVHRVEDRPGRRGGLAAELTDADGRSLAATDAAWRCLRSPAWRQGTFRFKMGHFDPYQEFYDARAEPAGWMEAGFDDAGWAAAEPVVDGPRAAPRPRDIPPMAVERRRPERIERIEECTWLENRVRGEDLSIALSQVGLPIRHAAAEGVERLLSGDGPAELRCSTEHLTDHTFDGVHEPCVVLDFGRVITAQIELDVDGPAGAMIDVGFVERLIDGQFNNAIEGQFAVRYTLAAGRRTWRSFTWRGFRYAKLRFRNCCEPIRLHAARAVVTTYPFEQRGAFRCGDGRVQKVFDISRYTIRLCCHESIMDTPWREQGQWLGDVAAVTLGAIYACFGDARLPAKFLRQSAATQRPDGLLENITNAPPKNVGRVIPDYSLWWIMGLWNHYLYTGDAELLADCCPAVGGIVEAFAQCVDDHGLVADMPQWVFIDWAHVDTRGQCAPLNAIFVGALEAAANIARACDDEAAARRAEALAAGVRASFARRLFDPARGVFADANVGGELSDMASEHASVAAIRFGLCDDSAAAEIVRRIYEDKSVRLVETQPFFTVVTLAALDRVGRFDLAMQVIRDRWGKRMVDRGATSTYEEWTQNGSRRNGPFSGFLRSHSHAWSACPAEVLIKTLAGVEILAPGCRKLRIAPRAVDFDYDLTYPTPLGPVRVWKENGHVRHTAPDAVEIVTDG